MVDAALEQAEHQSRIGGILNIRMQDLDSDDSDYRDPMSNDHDMEGCPLVVWPTKSWRMFHLLQRC